MKYLPVILFTLTIAAQWSHCQEPKRMTRSYSFDDAVILREIGAVIIPKENGLMVDIMLGNQEKEPSDVRKDDKLLMVNGQKVKTIKDLHSVYDGMKAGDAVKLGLMRGEHLLMATFVKKSDEEMNAGGGHGGMVMRLEKREGEVVLPALGVILTTQKGAAVIIGTLPTISKNFTTNTPAEGDIITSINGTDVTSAELFDEVYTELREGEEVTIVLSRKGKEMKEKFRKPKPAGGMMMRTK